MAGPVKRSVMIAGHATSVSLEPVFWTALEDAARQDALPISALVARIDAARVAERDPPNLASALRVWLFERALRPKTLSHGGREGPEPSGSGGVRGSGPR